MILIGVYTAYCLAAMPPPLFVTYFQEKRGGGGGGRNGEAISASQSPRPLPLQHAGAHTNYSAQEHANKDTTHVVQE